jgi:DNA-binding MarR family transcriptional regulator
MAIRQHAVNHKVRAPTRSPAGDAFSALAFRILRLGGLLTAAGDTLARPAKQTSARWQVLAAVEHAPATVAQIARALGLARQSVQRLADLLSDEGLTAYDDNPDHARAKLLRLAPKGRSALDTIQAAQRTWADEIGAQVGAAPLRRAAAVLDEVAAALAARGDQED